MFPIFRHTVFSLFFDFHDVYFLKNIFLLRVKVDVFPLGGEL